MKKKLAVAVALMLAIVGCIAGVLSAESVYSFTTISVKTDTFTQLLGINNDGEIVGYHGIGGASHPFVGET